MAKKTKAPKRRERAATPDPAAPAMAARAAGLLPPQRRPALRDMTCGVRVGVFPSQVDCNACETHCARLPHSWRQTCLAACHSACAVGRETAALGRTIGGGLASIGSRFATAFG
jgi:hypothetical protein